MKLTNCVPLIEIPPVGIRPTSMLRTPTALNMGCAHVGWAGVTEARDRAEGIWAGINRPNLVQNILPTRPRATLVLRKDSDHSINRVRLRKL